MRVRWDFFYEAKDFRFGRIHKFKGSISPAQAARFGLSGGGGEFLLRVLPDAECTFPLAEQSGKLELELPGRDGETEKFARWFIVRIAEQISFRYGLIKVHGGLVTGELLPETAQEWSEVGEERFLVRVRLEEVVDPTPIFDGATLSSITMNARTSRYIAQFNRALQSSNPVDRFLGLVRILEDFTLTSRNGSLAAALKNCRDLYDVAYRDVPIWVGGFPRKPTRDEVNELFDDLARIRDHCAHLRTEQGLGIPHGDPRVASQVEPLVEPLRRLCSCVIQVLLARDESAAPALGLPAAEPHVGS